MRRSTLVDALLAIAVASFSVVEAFVEQLNPISVSAPCAALAGTALFWRRRYPIPVALVLVVASVVQAVAGVSLHTSVAPVAGIFFASWSIGAYETRSRALLGLTILIGGVWLATGIDAVKGTDNYSGTDIPWIGLLIATPGVLGIAFGARTRSLRAAEARALQLELERREAIA